MALARWSPAVMLILGLVAVPSQAGAPSDASARAVQGVKAQVKRGTLTITGNRGANSLTLRLKRRARGTLEVDVRSNGSADFKFKRKTFKRIVVKSAGGNDTLQINERNGTFTRAERTTFDGGTGNDRLSGGRARETLKGGRGNDRITTDGSDRVTGGSGTDLVLFSGSPGADAISVAAKGALARLTRNVGNVGVDASGVERLAVKPLGGADTVNLGNLTGTGVVDTSVNLAATASGKAGDGAADTLAVSGTEGGESLNPSRGPGSLALGGLPWAVSASAVDATGDRLALNGLGGSDTLQLTGTDAAESFELAANGTLFRATAAGALVESDDVESVVVNALGGADMVSVANVGGTDIGQATLDLGVTPAGPADGQVDTVELSATGGADSVALSGGSGGLGVTGLAAGTSMRGVDAADRLSVNGLAGADALNASALGANVVALTLRGGPDADTLTGTPGNDSFRSDPGDGSDVVDGGAGADKLVVNGADAAETFQVSASGARALISRDVDSATIDSDAVEAAELTPAGGADSIVVNDLTGTDVSQAALDLAGTNGGGDSQADSITVNGRNADDVITASGSGSGANVTGLPTAVSIANAEGANDRLTLNALGGEDVVDSTALAANVLATTVNGGLGADVFVGGPGTELMNGGDGDDLALLGGGNDTFVWNPGDDNDTIEGQAGTDALAFNGSNASENIDVSANGGRVRFFRNVAAVTMDLNDLETVDFNALGGADNVAATSLGGTDLTRLNVALAAVGGAGDAQADTVMLGGTNGNDVVVLNGSGTSLTASGLAPTIAVTGAESANDRFILNLLNGDDVGDASAVAAGSMLLTMNGAIGDDVLVGGEGPDTLTGGDDDDVLIGNGGTDTLDGGPGSNVVIQ